MFNSSNANSVGTMRQIQNLLMQISIPYIIIVALVGLAGNVLTIIMLWKRSLTKNFNNCTVIALALTDLSFNITLVSRCLSDMTESNSDDFCRLLSFLSHLAELLSAGFTVHFTIQRFIAVKFPLSVFIEKNIHLLHYVIVTVFILFGVVYCLTLISRNDYDHCEEELNLFWFVSDALLSFVVPFTIIAILNLAIILHLRATCQHNEPVKPLRRRLTLAGPSSHSPRRKFGLSDDSTSQSRFSESCPTGNRKSSFYHYSSHSEPTDHFLSIRHSSTRRTASIRSTTPVHAQSHRVTRMLILVSTCFLLLNAPSHICTIGLKIYTMKMSPTFAAGNYSISSRNETSNVDDSRVLITSSSKINVKFFQFFYIGMIITQHISYLSYSINFFLYSFCGMKFRRELLRFFSKCRRRPRSKPTDRLSV